MQLTAESIILPLGKASIHVPAAEAANILLNKFIHDAAPPRADRPQALPRIGEYVSGQGGVYGGLMRGENGQPDYHLIWPTDASAHVQEIEWGGYEKDEPDAKSEFDGLANTIALCGSSISHPAAEWAAGLTIDGHKDFYLPSRRELRLAWVNVPELFEDGWYWSSTQYSPNFAWGQYFDDGNQLYGPKHYEGRARAGRRIIDLAL